MRSASLKTTAQLITLMAGLGLAPALGADLVWEVENPFRFFKPTNSFSLHEAAYRSVRGDPQSPPPADILTRLERRLNDPDCRDASNPAACAATARARYEQSRLGWAAQTFSSICYESNARPRRYPTQCERRYSWGTAREDYILPEAHTVAIRLAPAVLAQVGDGECTWSWQPRAPGGKVETRRLACKDKLTITRVPFSLNRALSGVAVSVRTHNGRQLAEPNVIVEDLLVVGFGNSFASGESNPDKPVIFSASRQMVYDPVNTPGVASRSIKKKDPAPEPSPTFSVAAVNEFDPKSLPKRLMEDEVNGRINWPTSREFLTAFEQSAAQWVSADCHRSQYGYPFRVGLGLALENRHRTVTFVSLACSGAEVTEGLFLEMSAREGDQKKVAAQFDQMSDLICRGGTAGRTQTATYAVPMFSTGSTGIQTQAITKRWCPPAQRKRPIDLVLLSIGGNDVGFGALAVYSITDSANDIAPVADLIGRQIRFSPRTARVYLEVLDERMQAVKDALRDGFGVDPPRVVHTSYEPIQFDETGAVCGAQPTLGLDVHPKFRFSRERLQETSDFLRDFLARLECVSSVRRRADCPAGLATGAGTGFNLVTEHQVKFLRRGMCARDPSRLAIDGAAMSVPRVSKVTDNFKPYSPDNTLPYARTWRLFRTPNDAFMTANTHREGISPFDLLQPAYSGLQSGAIHPTAEAHAIVADHVMPYARAILDRRAVVRAEPPR